MKPILLAPALAMDKAPQPGGRWWQLEELPVLPKSQPAICASAIADRHHRSRSIFERETGSSERRCSCPLAAILRLLLKPEQLVLPLLSTRLGGHQMVLCGLYVCRQEDPIFQKCTQHVRAKNMSLDQASAGEKRRTNNNHHLCSARYRYNNQQERGGWKY